MKIIRSLIVLIVLTTTVASAQSKKALKYFNKAREEVRDNNLEAALDDLDKALEDSPNYIDALLFKADLLKKAGRPDETIPIYEKALAAGAPYYVYLFFGEALFDAKEYERSIEALNKYAESPRATRKYLDKVNELISNSEFALKATANAKPYNPQNLGSKVNGRSMEYFPSISADGLTLVFTHRDPDSDQGDEDFWFSTRDSVNRTVEKSRPCWRDAKYPVK